MIFLLNSAGGSFVVMSNRHTNWDGLFVDVEIPVDPYPRKNNPNHVKAQLVVGRIKNKNGKFGGAFYFLCGYLQYKFQTQNEFLTYVLQLTGLVGKLKNITDK